MCTAAPSLVTTSCSSWSDVGHRGSWGTPSRDTFLRTHEHININRHEHDNTCKRHSDVDSQPRRPLQGHACTSLRSKHTIANGRPTESVKSWKGHAATAPAPPLLCAVCILSAVSYASTAAPGFIAGREMKRGVQHDAIVRHMSHLQCQVSSRLSSLSGSTSRPTRSLHNSTITTCAGQQR